VSTPRPFELMTVYWKHQAYSIAKSDV